MLQRGCHSTGGTTSGIQAAKDWVSHSLPEPGGRAHWESWRGGDEGTPSRKAMPNASCACCSAAGADERLSSSSPEAGPGALHIHPTSQAMRWVPLLQAIRETYKSEANTLPLHISDCVSGATLTGITGDMHEQCPKLAHQRWRTETPKME